MNEFVAYASVILDVSVDKSLDYGITRELHPILQCGMRVEVPVRGQLRRGYIIDIKQKPDFSPVKPIMGLVSDDKLISEELFKLSLWMSQYYCAPLRDIFKILLPPSVRKAIGHKQQLFVMRAKTKEEIKQICIKIRSKKSAQAAILDVMLKVKKGILLSKLLEESGSSRSAVDALEKAKILHLDLVRIDRSPFIEEEYFQTKPKKLNEDQASALNKICQSLKEHRFETHLLYGVTGSGKTEVYLQAIDKALFLGKGTIMLVPEISLTGQIVERFRSRFQEKIAILHHRLSPGERNDEWHHIRSGKAKIVIGARSAIFSPVVNLGLIIVDEEQEQSYKQSDTSPCYQARDIAVMRGKLENSSVILGSATPSLESYYNAQRNKYTLSILHERADIALLPNVTVVDMKKEFEKNKGFTNFSELLLNGIKQRQEIGEQTILFLNRRGYHTMMRCPDCQKAVTCAHCDASMTFHLEDNRLSCHLCNYQIFPPRECPSCHGAKPLKFKGVGTEQVERALHAVLSEVRVLRMDADTTRHKGSHQKLLHAFGTGKADVLIGTQMIAKGLHFPEVTLVGVLNSDASLNIPDFRASETVFQLITQVAGRSGRGISRGEVIIQTSMPENQTIQHASRQDYLGFYQSEIEVREMFCYPPFSRLAKMIFSGSNADQTLEAAKQVSKCLMTLLPSYFEFNPIVPCGHAKIKGKHRYQLLLRAPQVYPHLNLALKRIQETYKLPSSITLFIDVDPSSTFF